MSPINDQLNHQPTLHFIPLGTHYQLPNAKRGGRLRRHVTPRPRDPALASRGATQLPQPEGGARCAQTQPATTMLSRLLKEHQAKQNERKELQEKRRREAITAATCLTEALVDHLNVGVAQAYMNQRKLDHEVKTLQVQAAQFAKQTGQWIGMVENFNQALKEIGDVENWARSIELDMRTIATALEYVYKGQLQSAPS